MYVQDLIEEDSARVWELVGVEDAWVYISGYNRPFPGSFDMLTTSLFAVRPTKCPFGVKGAIKNAAIKEGGMTEEDADKWIGKLEWEGRLVEECWS